MEGKTEESKDSIGCRDLTSPEKSSLTGRTDSPLATLLESKELKGFALTVHQPLSRRRENLFLTGLNCLYC